MGRIYFYLPVIGEVIIELNDEELIAFTKRQFIRYFVKEELQLKNPAEIDVRIINKKLTSEVLSKIENIEKLSRGFKVDGNIITYNLFKYSINNDIIEIATYQNSKFSLVKLLKKLFRVMLSSSKEKKYAYYHMKFYQTILFPVFSLYALYYGYYCIHGSLIRCNEKNIVISGLDGVGKSSLCNELKKLGSSNIMADNFVLYNGSTAVPLLMPLRLEKNQITDMEEIYNDKNIKEVIPREIEHKQQKVNTIFTVCISQHFKMQKKECSNEHWMQYLNNAIEIGACNQFLAPFLYFNFEKSYNEMPDFYLLEVTLGEIREGAEAILSEC